MDDYTRTLTESGCGQMMKSQKEMRFVQLCLGSNECGCELPRPSMQGGASHPESLEVSGGKPSEVSVWGGRGGKRRGRGRGGGDRRKKGKGGISSASTVCGPL